ncbi:MAG: hypothetical protein J7M24_06130 [Candidatus Latescibacteria bacterium]|nr:hypothetical protein [Candidatus Latescibacterota bacterium]
MVRPIEITDSLSKTEAVQRLQQNQKILPEATNQFQKTLTDKLTQDQVKTPNPVPKGDEVVIHVDEREKEKEKGGDAGEHRPPEKEADETGGESRKRGNDGGSTEHIDIKA